MRKIIVTAFALVSAMICHGQSLSTLQLPTDARTVAMGAASAPFAYGPAGKLQADVDYTMWAPKTAGLTIVSADIRYRVIDRLTVGIDFAQYTSKPYDVMTSAGKADGSFSPKDMRVGLGLGFDISGSLSASANIRFASSSIAPEAKGSAVCADVNVNYASDFVKVGAGICNLGTKVSYGESSYPLPAYARVGAAFVGVENLVASAEVDYLLAGAVMAGVGAEYTVADIVSVRAGYHYGPKDAGYPSFLSLGLGAGYKGVALNVAYVLGSEALGNTLSAGLSVRF